MALALGVVGVSFLSLFGLMAVGIRTAQESVHGDEMTNLLSKIVQQRKAAPVANEADTFVLPPVDVDVDTTGTATLTREGVVVPGGDPARFYQIDWNIRRLNGTQAQVYVSLREFYSQTRQTCSVIVVIAVPRT
jgi:hypothetical protein